MSSNKLQGSCADRNQLVFCYSQSKPYSLVMLYPHAHLIQKMLKPPSQIYFLWILKQPTEQLLNKIHQTQIETNSTILPFSNSLQIKQFLQKNLQLKNLLIICSLQQARSIQPIDRRRQISAIVQFPAKFVEVLVPDYDDEEDQGEKEKEKEEKLGKEYAHMKASTQGSLFNLIRSYCGTAACQFRELMNFVPIQGEIWKVNVLVRTMMAIINQDIDIETRRQILHEFQKVSSKIQKSTYISQLLEQMKKGPLRFDRAIYWYTHTVGLYKIVNNLLRSSEHPSQVFYLLPFFKDIFSAIKKIYYEERAKNRGVFNRFMCYRGGSISKSEIKQLQNNVGSIVKNLSFLSTSRNQQTALMFMKNVVFEITVTEQPIPKDQTQQSSFQYGYANVNKYSYFYGQQQIIFNPLNSFKITEIQQIQLQPQQYVIKLQYGVLGKLMKKDRERQRDKEREMEMGKEIPIYMGMAIGEGRGKVNQGCLCYLGKMWKKEEARISHQGLVLVDETGSLKYASEYWQKYTQIMEDPILKIQGLFQLSRSQKNNSKFQASLTHLLTAQTLYTQIPQLPHFSNPPPHPPAQLHSSSTLYLYLNLKLQQSAVYKQLGQFEQCQEILSEGIEFVGGLFGEGNQIYWGFLKGFCELLVAKNQNQKAKELLQKLSTSQSKSPLTTPSTLPQILTDLSHLHNLTGNHSQSLSLQQKSTQILLLTQGQKHPSYIYALGRLAKIYNIVGEFGKAERVLGTCCRLIRAMGGGGGEGGGDGGGSRGIQGAWYLRILVVLGGNYRGLGKCDQGVDVFQQYFQQVGSEGQSYPRYIQALNQYSLILYTQGNLQKSLQIQQKSHLLAHTFLPPTNPLHLTTLHNLGYLLKCHQSHAKAIQIFQKCLLLRKRVLGPTHADTINTVCMLANSLYQMGRYGEIGGLLGGFKGWGLNGLGEVDLWEVETVCLWAITLAMVGGFGRAELLLGKARVTVLRTVGQMHSDHVRTLSSLARVWTWQKKFQKALDLYQECCQVGLKVFGERNIRYIQILNEMAMVHLHSSHPHTSLKIQKKSCKLSQPTYPPSLSLSLNHIDNKNKYIHIHHIRNLQCLMLIQINFGKYWDAIGTCGKILGWVGVGLGEGEDDGSWDFWVEEMAKMYKHIGQHRKARKVIKKLQKPTQQSKKFSHSSSRKHPINYLAFRQIA